MEKYSQSNPRPIPVETSEYFSYCASTGVIKRIKLLEMAHGVRVNDNVGKLNSNGYLQMSFKRKSYLVHRVAYFLHHRHQPKMIDHINGIRSDNRIDNIRECTHSQNMRNQSIYSNNTSGMKGIHLREGSRKWRVRLTIAGEVKNIGDFKSLSRAIKARRQAEIKYFKEFRRAS